MTGDSKDALRPPSRMCPDPRVPLLCMWHSQEPPFALFDGTARPKALMYFVQRHATHHFELPPNPHLTREQHAMWKVQVADLPPEKVKAAYDTLQHETGLPKEEL
jgi:hypothetical protein